MILREMLPVRSAEDVLAGRIRFTFGTGDEATEFSLFVLPINANDAWKKLMEQRIGGVYDVLDNMSTKLVMGLLGNMTDTQIELLLAYDKAGVLDEAWLREHATGQQVLSAFLGVAAAAHPLAESVIEALSGNAEMWQAMAAAMTAPSSTPPTSSAPPNTAGRPKKSKKR